MTEVEPQHNVAVWVRATRGGETMTERSDEDLRSGRADSSIPSDLESKAASPEHHESESNSGEARGSVSDGRRRAAPLSPQIRDRLAMQLRSMYDTVASQPVPDRFAELIAQLDSADRDAG
jgi:hypothetical protein